jgi:hypothetical protein
VGPSDFLRLSEVTPQRICGCGQRVRWSHLQYLGKGRSAPVYVCSGCGLAYRGHDAEAAQERPASRSKRPLPDQGPPDNPVIDEDVAARLRELFPGS